MTLINGSTRGRLNALLKAIERRDAETTDPMRGLADRLEAARLRADENPPEPMTDDEIAAKRRAMFAALREEQRRRW